MCSLFELGEVDNKATSDDIERLLSDNNIIFRIGRNQKSDNEKLQLLILKLLVLLWENEDKQEETLERMEEKMQMIDDIRHEIAFLRARYYKRIFSRKVGFKY